MKFEIELKGNTYLLELTRQILIDNSSLLGNTQNLTEEADINTQLKVLKDLLKLFMLKNYKELVNNEEEFNILFDDYLENYNIEDSIKDMSEMLQETIPSGLKDDKSNLKKLRRVE